VTGAVALPDKTEMPIMIMLSQSGRLPRLPGASPFCIKLESWLRLAGLPYTLMEADDRQGVSKRSLPRVISETGRSMDGLRRVMQHVRSEARTDPDAWLTTDERVFSQAVGHLYADWLVPAMVWLGWVEEESWPGLRAIYAPPEGQSLPVHLDPLREHLNLRICELALREEERERVTELVVREVESLTDFLGSKPFFFGDQPSSVDCTVFALLVVSAAAPPESALGQLTHGSYRIGDYVRRMVSRLYPEMQPQEAA
jgi:hypothetical protein